MTAEPVPRTHPSAGTVRSLVGDAPVEALVLAAAVPLLFLHGEADQQVFLDVDFRAWQDELAGEQGVEFRSYPGLSHFVWESQGDSALADLEYPATVDDAVVTDIADWLVSHSG